MYVLPGHFGNQFDTVNSHSIIILSLSYANNITLAKEYVKAKTLSYALFLLKIMLY